MIDASARYRAAVDIGGTFTDIVMQGPDGRLLTHKRSSTTDDYGRAIVAGLRALCDAHAIAPGQVDEIVHGTTVAANTVLEGKGARTGLITTAGFRDVLELRRVRLAELYNMDYDRPAALVPRRRRLEVPERVDANGQVLLPLDVEAAAIALRALAADGIDALAICLLHAYANPVHEQALARLASELLPARCFISVSHVVLPEIQEYERTSTTVINAFLGPAIGRYCRRLQQALAEAGFQAPLRIMQSSGGILTLDEVLRFPARILESGPAAGVIGSAAAGRRWGMPNLLTIDMGGTTAKAALVEDGQPGRTNEYEVGAGINVSSRLVKGRGHALKLPVIDISEIGAGGGSIARVGPHGMLAVGPDSAGAVPGPACYGTGGDAATLTDAMVTLGYVNPDYLVGGAVRIDATRSRRAVATDVAEPLGLPLLAAAHGIYVLAATTMTRAVKAVSTLRGRDPRDFTLFAFGGNGPLMAAEIARVLEIERILIPRHAGIHSAVGLLHADVERSASRTWLRRLGDVNDADLAAELGALAATACGGFDDADRAGLVVRHELDLRYHGQAFELTVACAPAATGLVAAARAAFVAEHRRTYGHGSDADPVDLVTLRVVATLPTRTPVGTEGGGRAHDERTTPGADPASSVESSDVTSMRRVYFGPQAAAVATPVIDRGAIATGRAGPFIVEELDTTVLVPPGWYARLGDEAAILLERRA